MSFISIKINKKVMNKLTIYFFKRENWAGLDLVWKIFKNKIIILSLSDNLFTKI